MTEAQDSLQRRLLAEAIGTFALVFAGCGSVAVNAGGLGVSLAFGGVIAIMIIATGHISGAHFNPAVTLTFVSLGRISTKDAGAYIATQIGAATLGAFALAEI